MSFENEIRETNGELEQARKFDKLLQLFTLGIFNLKKRIAKLNDRLRKFQKLQARLEVANAASDQYSIVDKTKTIGGVARSGSSEHGTQTILMPARYGSDWDTIRREILHRDNFSCQEADHRCTNVLQVHHKIPLSRGGSNSPDNLITLCKFHHSQKHPHMKP